MVRNDRFMSLFYRITGKRDVRGGAAPTLACPLGKGSKKPTLAARLALGEAAPGRSQVLPLISKPYQ